MTCGLSGARKLPASSDCARFSRVAPGLLAWIYLEVAPSGCPRGPPRDQLGWYPPENVGGLVVILLL